MFNSPFYFGLVRKYVILVGTLFNDIKISRTDGVVDTTDCHTNFGAQTALIKVPITYAPKDKMLARITQDSDIDRDTAVIPLPAISFEMIDLAYDSSRKLGNIKQTRITDCANSSITASQFNPVPYNLKFRVYVYAKNAEDGTKIIEQILPFFTPDFTASVHLIPEMCATMDIPIVMDNIDLSDTYEGSFKDRRSIIWTLDLTVKGYFYGPIKTSKLIKFANINMYTPAGTIADAIGVAPVSEKITVQPGLDANSTAINYYGGPNNTTGTIAYTSIEKDDDYGFVTMIYDTDDLI